MRNGKFFLGYTLIELLIVISLIGILSSVGLAVYNNFNRNQLITASAKKIVGDLRLTQSLAANNQKPADSCGVLNGYIFVISGTSYHIDVDCSNPVYNNNPVKTGFIASNIVTTGFTRVKFMVLRQGIIFTGGQTLTLTAPGFSKTKIITVDRGGGINISE